MRLLKITTLLSKKWLAIIFLFALVEPINYFFLIHYPLPGKTFMAYDSDEALNSGIMRSVEINFDNPWSPGEKIFFNGALGSPYPYILLGYIRAAINIDAVLLNIIAKLLLSIVFLIVLFATMKILMPRKHEIAFLFFLLPLGLMPLGYIFGLSTGIERFMEGFSYEFSMLSNISRVYYYVPLIFGFLSIISFTKGRKLYSSISLGLVFFFYPFFGFAFSWIIFLYAISGKSGTIINKLNQTVSETWKIYLTASIFLIPWLYVRFLQPEYFILYSKNSQWWRAHITGIIGSYIVLLVIILISNLQTAKKYWKFLLATLVFTIIILFSELNLLGVPPFKYIKLLDIVVELTEILLVVMFTVAWIVLDSNIDRRHKFIILFALTFFPLSIINPKYAFWQQYRMGWILHIPLAMLAAFYFDSFLEKMKSFGIGRLTVLILISTISITSFLAYNYRFQMTNRLTGSSYFDDDDKAAMKFLDKMEKGIVMASEQTNIFLPTWSGQYVLYHPAESQYLGGNPNRSQKKLDSYNFYMSSNESEILYILQKYNVKYVFYGSRERQIRPTDFDSYKFLEKIYENKTKIYRVVSI